MSTKTGAQIRGANGKPTWRLEFMAGRDPEKKGKHQRVYERFYGTEKQAQEYWYKRQAEIDRDVESGGFTKPAKETVGDYLTAWLTNTGPGILKAKTLAGYRQVADLFLVPLLGALPLSDLSARHVEEATGRIVRPKAEAGFGLSARTGAYAHAVLRRILNDAVRRGDLARNAASLAVAPRGESKQVHGYTLADMQALMAAAQGNRLEALFGLSWQSGLRLGEILGLRWTDCDLGKGTVAVRQTVVAVKGGLQFDTPKTKASRRTIVLPATAVEALEIHRGRQYQDRQQAGDGWREHGLVFCTQSGGPLFPRNVERTWYTLRDRAKLEPQGFHALRHTYGSLALSAGVPLEAVAENLGHTDISFTKRVYADVLLDLKRAAADRMDAFVRTGQVAISADSPAAPSE
jgi:integrase